MTVKILPAMTRVKNKNLKFKQKEGEKNLWQKQK